MFYIQWLNVKNKIKNPGNVNIKEVWKVIIKRNKSDLRAFFFSYLLKAKINNLYAF